MSKKEKYSESATLEGAIGYWMYNVQEDTLILSERTKHILGLNRYTRCGFNSFKSIVIGSDIPRFVKGFNQWINGNTSHIIQIRIVDNSNNIKVIQIKGHLRTNIRDREMILYGAYINISYWNN